jgi:hypothetical protein
MANTCNQWFSTRSKLPNAAYGSPVFSIVSITAKPIPEAAINSIPDIK